MARKLVLFILLLAAWAVVYFFITEPNKAPFTYFFSAAHPSRNPLPEPWSSQQARASLLPLEEMVGDQVSGSGCPAEYHVQTGDTLGKIADRCGVYVTDLQALNPSLINPNRIYPGQRLVIYGNASKGEMSLSSSKSVSSAAPGSILRIEAAGLPAGANTRIGIGLSSIGYQVLTTARVSDTGVLSVEVTVPENALTGDRAFVLVTTDESPPVQTVTETFVIYP